MSILDRESILATPPDQVSWLDIGMLTEEDAEAGEALWNSIRAEARDELATGHRTAAALDYRTDPWDRAQYLAIRDEFREQWQPRGSPGPRFSWTPDWGSLPLQRRCP